MKRITALIIIAVFMLTSCSSTVTTDDGNSAWKEYSSKGKAERSAGFKFNVPGQLDGWATWYFKAQKKKAIQITYEVDNKYQNGELDLRKGITEDVVKEDYDEYKFYYDDFKYSNTVQVDKIKVNITGESDGVVNRAVWANDDYYYSLATSDPTFTEEDLAEIVKSVN